MTHPIHRRDGHLAGACYDPRRLHTGIPPAARMAKLVDARDL